MLSWKRMSEHLSFQSQINLKIINSSLCWWKNNWLHLFFRIIYKNENILFKEIFVNLQNQFCKLCNKLIPWKKLTEEIKGNKKVIIVEVANLLSTTVLHIDWKPPLGCCLNDIQTCGIVPIRIWCWLFEFCWQRPRIAVLFSGCTRSSGSLAKKCFFRELLTGSHSE